MPEHKHKHSRRDRRDDKDIFREDNLRAIHRRKQYARIMFVVVSIIAALMLALVYAAYFLDK
ncbi:putative uncharacterized protein [Prevotella sp. CAG:520]|nr:putative uncharacterized protein [Prevotella sp. CAG:520]